MSAVKWLQTGTCTQVDPKRTVSYDGHCDSAVSHQAGRKDIDEDASQEEGQAR